MACSFAPNGPFESAASSSGHDSARRLDFQLIFESVPTPYLLIDTTFTIVAVSNEYLRSTMTQREAIIGRNIFDVFPDNPEEISATGTSNLKASLDRVLELRLPDTMPLQKYDIRNPDGSFQTRYWNPVNTPVLTPQGEVSYIIHRAEDVTDYVALRSQDTTNLKGTEYLIHKHSQEMAAANERLRQLTHTLKTLYEKTSETSQARLRAVVDNALDGLISINKEGSVESFNPACERIFGYLADEVIGKNIKMLMPEPYHSEHDGYLSHYLQTGKAKIIGTAGREVSGLRKNGSVFPIDLSVCSFELEDGVHFSGILRDITDRKEAERLLREETARMQAVMNTVLDGLITIDELGIVQTFNPAAARIFGYRADEVIGQNVKMLMPEPYQSSHDGYLHNYMTTGDPKIIGSGREVSGRRKDGSVFAMELGVNEMHVTGKRMFVGTVRDISARKQAEQEIQQYLIALKRSNQELDDFAYIASHDLKEPLRGLSNNAVFLREDYAEVIGEEGVKRLTRMSYLCERMERLVNDLLYFSRLGRQELAVQPTNLNEVIHDIESMIETSLHEANATIRVPEKLPTIICDLPRITEVFRNLITNAIKYNDKPVKDIEIGYTINGGTYVYYVRDNGIGIPTAFYHDVFRIFKRLNDEDDSVKGTGVGLTFVKKIIERHQGRIWVDSQVGVGTTFYFTIHESTSA